MWVRGLKLGCIGFVVTLILSHPMWVRGLKLNSALIATLESGRTLCGCVD